LFLLYHKVSEPFLSLKKVLLDLNLFLSQLQRRSWLFLTFLGCNNICIHLRKSVWILGAVLILFSHINPSSYSSSWTRVTCLRVIDQVIHVVCYLHWHMGTLAVLNALFHIFGLFDRIVAASESLSSVFLFLHFNACFIIISFFLRMRGPLHGIW